MRVLRQAQDERFRDGGRDERGVGGARRRWSPELGERFVALVLETGNARQSAIALGAPNAFNNRMRRDPDFRRRVAEAAAAADERLSEAGSPFLPRIEYKSMTPPDGGEGPPRGGKLAADPEAPGGFPGPGRKRGPSGPQPVIRRNSKGRMQVTLARDGQMTAETEADFLALLRATGNFGASARAVGFTPASVHERVRKWAAFARDCEAALAEADIVLTYKLTAHAHALLRRPGEAAESGIAEEEAPFDPVTAMKILAHIDARKYGRSGKGRRKGPPERSFGDACRSILAKIEAIERHERLSRQGGASAGAGKPAGERPTGGEKEEGGDGGAA